MVLITTGSPILIIPLVSPRLAGFRKNIHGIVKIATKYVGAKYVAYIMVVVKNSKKTIASISPSLERFLCLLTSKVCDSMIKIFPQKQNR